MTPREAARDAVAALERSGAWPPGQHAQAVADAALSAGVTVENIRAALETWDGDALVTVRHAESLAAHLHDALTGGAP